MKFSLQWPMGCLRLTKLAVMLDYKPESLWGFEIIQVICDFVTQVACVSYETNHFPPIK